MLGSGSLSSACWEARWMHESSWGPLGPVEESREASWGDPEPENFQIHREARLGFVGLSVPLEVKQRGNSGPGGKWHTAYVMDWFCRDFSGVKPRETVVVGSRNYLTTAALRLVHLPPFGPVRSWSVPSFKPLGTRIELSEYSPSQPGYFYWKRNLYWAYYHVPGLVCLVWEDTELSKTRNVFTGGSHSRMYSSPRQSLAGRWAVKAQRKERMEAGDCAGRKERKGKLNRWSDISTWPWRRILTDSGR